MRYLKELRQQRNLVQQHLEWLDREIAELQADAPRQQPKSPAATSDERTNTSQPTKSAPSAVPSAVESTPTKATNTDTDAYVEALLEQEKYPTNNIGFGCVFMGVLFIILVLFVLFVLPYLIY